MSLYFKTPIVVVYMRCCHSIRLCDTLTWYIMSILVSRDTGLKCHHLMTDYHVDD